ncbi:sensor histidine kinase [Sphaerisporangium sp. NPDC004334]
MAISRSSLSAAWAGARPPVADASLGGVLAAVSLLALVLRARAEHMPPPGPAAVVLVLLITLPLAWRRRHPFWVNLGVGMGSAVYGATPLPDLVTPVPIGGVVALYSMAAWCENRRWSVAIGVLSGGAVMAVALAPATDSDALDLAFGVLSLGSAWVLGDSARIRRAYTAELEARTAWLARERDFEARRAVTAERARIARELHDVIAHHVSMMVVQAEAGPVAAERDGLAAGRAFDTISGIGRQALVEMRRLLGVLREETGDGGPSLAPQPGVAELPALVEQVRRTGLDATLRVEGDPVPLPAGVDLSAYRIVQEALTNVLKHAGHTRVRVRIRYDQDDLRVEVRDSGSGDRRPVPDGGAAGGRPVASEGCSVLDGAAAGGTVAPGGPPVLDGRGTARGPVAPGGRLLLDGGVAGGSVASDRRAVRGAGDGAEGLGRAVARGHGLAGMRERAQLFGGELAAGPGPDGGFTVAARLPIGGTR